MHRTIIRFLLLTGLSAWLLTARAGRDAERGTDPAIRVSSSAYYGFIMPHHPEMKVFTNRHLSLFSLEVSKLTNGALNWHQVYNFPEIGLGYLYSDLGGSEILGNVHALYPYVDFPLIRGKEAKLAFRFGAGLAWLGKKFDRIDNYKNTAIGSHLNAAIAMSLLFEMPLSRHIGFRVGAAFIHFSNAATRLPNYGLNIPAVQAGLTCRIRNRPAPEMAPLTVPRNFVPEFQAIFSGGNKEIFPVGGPQYFVYNLALNVVTPVNRYFIAGIGFDLTYDRSDRELLRRTGVSAVSDAELVKYAANLAGGVRLGKLDLLLHAGVYLHQKDKSDGWVYDKIVVNYLLTKNILVNLTLKTHYAKADFVALGLGLKI